MNDERKQLIRRTVEIDYTQKHRHASGSLSALGIMHEVFERFNTETDVFILSKGHAAPALYACLEWLGYAPDISKPHPDRDNMHGIPCVTGSLGHGLPVAAGIALAKKLEDRPGRVFVLLGDGETLEGTTWETLHLAEALELDNLNVLVDWNSWQGSCRTICDTRPQLESFANVRVIETKRGAGVPILEAHQEWHTHTITDEEFRQIMEELK